MDRPSSGRQLVVVALPRENDPIRKVSSEKEPHLTLLYLGDYDYTEEQLERVSDYIELASASLDPFYLDTSYRGKLGDNNADVVFFTKKEMTNLVNFRNVLLQNDLIFTAYSTAEQYDEWTPHLTLGYPETPAKNVEFDVEDGFIRFDRIALWVGDSDGPTFKLHHKDFDMEVAMSQLSRDPTSANVLTHHGVKGMKWGIRKSDGGGGGGGSASAATPRASQDAKNVDRLHDKADRGGTHALSNKELQDAITRMNLEQQYHRLTAEGPSKNSMDHGLDAVNRMLKLGKTYNDIIKFMNSPGGKAVKAGVTAAHAFVKFHTHGPAGAAGVVVKAVRN